VDYSGALSDEEKAKPVARVNGETISMGDLYTEVGGSLIKLRTEGANKEYSLKKRGLDEMIETRLLASEAKTRGVSVEELLKTEVEAKMAKPSDAELEAFFNQNRRRLPPTATFDEHKEEIAKVMGGRKAEEARTAYVKTLTEKAKVETMLPFPELPAVPVSGDDDARRGSATALIQIIEWSDYQCPYCQKNVETMKKLEEKYGDKVSVVFRDFPLPFHDKAQKAAEAAECAGDQNKYWEYHDYLFANQGSLDMDSLKKAAGQLGLEATTFNTCLDSGKHKEEVEKDLAEGKVAGVTGTPAAFINGKMINGAQPIENYIAVIDGELARAGAAGH